MQENKQQQFSRCLRGESLGDISQSQAWFLLCPEAGVGQGPEPL